MDFQRQEWLVSRLNGYVMAMSAIDGVFGDSNADAYLTELDENNLLGSLKSHLQQEIASQYIYDSISEIHKPWSRKLVLALDAFFFKRPFSIAVDLERNRQIKQTREEMVTRVDDLVGLITNDYACEKIYRVEMHNDDAYIGFMHIFPLSKRFLVLKTISRIT